LKNPEKVALGMEYAQPGAFDERQRLAVPYAAELRCVTSRTLVLPASESRAITSAMFQEQELPIAPAYPRHFSEGAQRIRKSTQAESVDDGVKRFVSKTHALDIHGLETNVATETTSASLRPLEHPWTEIDAGELAIRRIELQASGRADRDFEHASARLLEQTLPHASEASQLRTKLNEIVPAREGVILLRELVTR
jgi:hypothetical protein